MTLALRILYGHAWGEIGFAYRKQDRKVSYINGQYNISEDAFCLVLAKEPLFMGSEPWRSILATLWQFVL